MFAKCKIRCFLILKAVIVTWNRPINVPISMLQSATSRIIDRRIPRYDVGSVWQTLRGVFSVTIFVIRIPGTNFINTVVDFSCFVTNTGDASENYFEQAN